MELGKFDAADFVNALLELLPRGLAWPRNIESVWGKVMAGIAPELARVQTRAADFLRELDPTQTTELLAEHELLAGLPDACSPVIDTVANRRAALVAKLTENTGHATPDYQAIATAAGFPSTVFYRKPFKVARARSRAGERAYGDHWAYVYAIAYMAHVAAAHPNQQLGWSATNAQWNGADYQTAVAPNGTLTSDKLRIFAGVGQTYRTVTTAPGGTAVQWSIWLRSDNYGDIPMTMRLTIGTDVIERQIVVTNRWSRFWIRSAVPSGASVELRLLNTDSAGVTRYVCAWGCFVGIASHAFECRMRRVLRAHVHADYRVVGDAPY